MPTPLANWNGELLPLDEVRVSVMDRSFLFGDAVYEAIRVYAGRPFLLAEHLDRLRRSLEKLRIDADVDRFAERLHTTLQHSGVQEGLIYMHISRGAAAVRTHYFPIASTTPNELIFVKELTREPYGDLHARGARVITYPDVRWKRCDIKSANLLGNVLASQAAVDAGCDEAILVADDGSITEGSHTSLFGVDDGAIITAPLEANVLPGITRSLVVRLAQEAGIEVREWMIDRDTITRLDEVFITGTTVDVLSVVEIDGETVGNGKPGPVTQRLRAAYLRLV
ncbi:MAG: D-amino acid aminotransferase [Planctomycetaceae bacterium]